MPTKRANRGRLHPQQLLKELEDSVWTVKFDDALDLVTKNINALKSSVDVNDLVSLRLRCLAAEILDYAGRYEDAETVISEPGGRCRNSIVPYPSSDVQRSLLKQQIWAVTHLGFTLYRKGDYTQARVLFEHCKNLVHNHLQTREHPCSGTLARIYYCIGLVQRQCHEYSAAKQTFTQSIDFSWSAIVKKRHPALHAFHVGKCLGLGLGWIYYTEGLLHIARPLLISARLLLTQTDEQMIKAYVDVIYATLQRAEKADSPDGLNEAIKILQGSYSVFEERGHLAYKVRAANELGLAYLALARHFKDDPQLLQKAIDFQEEVYESSHEYHDPRYECNSLILKSRIARYQGDTGGARDAANEAMQRAGDQAFNRIDALIALGEASLEDTNYEEASRSFGQALKDGGKNPKVTAVCNLYLARTSFLLRRPRLARFHWDEWQQVAGDIENAFIRQLAARVGDEIQTLSSGFFVGSNEEDLTAAKWVRDLRRHLALTARDRAASSDEDARQLIGVSLPTFYKYLKGH